MVSHTGNELTNKWKKIICFLVTYISTEEAENKLNIQHLSYIEYWQVRPAMEKDM